MTRTLPQSEIDNSIVGVYRETRCESGCESELVANATKHATMIDLEITSDLMYRFLPQTKSRLISRFEHIGIIRLERISWCLCSANESFFFSHHLFNNTVYIEKSLCSFGRSKFPIIDFLSNALLRKQESYNGETSQKA